MPQWGGAAAAGLLLRGCFRLLLRERAKQNGRAGAAARERGTGRGGRWSVVGGRGGPVGGPVANVPKPS